MVGQGQGLDRIGRGVEEGRIPGLLEVLQIVDQLLPQLEVKSGQRVIENEDLRLLGDPPRDRHPLLLPAGKLIGPLAEQIGDLQHLGRMPDDRLRLSSRHPRQLQRIGDVVVDTQMRIERERLRDVTDVAIGRRYPRHVLSAQPNLTGVWLLQTHQNPHQHRLAGRRRTVDNHEVARRDRKIDAAQDDGIAVGLGDSAIFDQRG